MLSVTENIHTKSVINNSKKWVKERTDMKGYPLNWGSLFLFYISTWTLKNWEYYSIPCNDLQRFILNTELSKCDQIAFIVSKSESCSIKHSFPCVLIRNLAVDIKRQNLIIMAYGPWCKAFDYGTHGKIREDLDNEFSLQKQQAPKTLAV